MSKWATIMKKIGINETLLLWVGTPIMNCQGFLKFALSFLDLSLMRISALRVQRVQWWGLASRGHPPWPYLVLDVIWEPKCFPSWPLIPMFLSSLVIDMPPNPLATNFHWVYLRCPSMLFSVGCQFSILKLLMFVRNKRFLTETPEGF